MATASPFLDECRATCQANAAQIAALADLTEEEAKQSAKPGTWSVAQCIDHAIMTTELYLPYMQAALARGRDRGVRGTGALGRGALLGRMLVNAMDRLARNR